MERNGVYFARIDDSMVPFSCSGRPTMHDAVATAAPAKRCLQVDAIPVFPVRALHGRIIGLLAVGFTGHACSPQTFLPVTNQKWRGNAAPGAAGLLEHLSCFYSDVSGKC